MDNITKTDFKILIEEANRTKRQGEFFRANREKREQEKADKEKLMTLEEFKKLYQIHSKNWNFNLFAIKCLKCDSEKVEFNSNIYGAHGYYDDYTIEGRIIIKCHNCGNAQELNSFDLEE